LFCFADVGDRLSIARSDHPSLEIDGPFARALEGEAGDNLVMRAARAVLAKARGPQPPFRIVLTKVLPVAAGLGGGSSDAGAALRLVRDALELRVSDDELLALASGLGADGAACFHARPVMAEGRGERLSKGPDMPVLDAVLVNPGVACPTGAVYRAYDAAPDGQADRPLLPERFESPQDAAAFLSYCRNDLEGPAIRVEGAVQEALSLLRGEPETLLARLSGSGATAFALCAGDIEAQGLAERIAAMRPAWWVRPCRLGGPWPD
jgi:4-diphosphocytidyl-2-C-methyl-D-erythritol kinase